MNTTKSVPSPREIHGKFMKINRLHRKAVENRFSDCRIHRSQHGILMFLSRSEHTPTQKEIAERFEVSPAAVATSLKKLEAEGYISRQANKSDTRENMISITEKGRQMVVYSRATFDELDRVTYSGLSDEELSSLDQILTKIIANIE